jgi:hypothetical protein
LQITQVSKNRFRFKHLGVVTGRLIMHHPEEFYLRRAADIRMLAESVIREEMRADFEAMAREWTALARLAHHYKAGQPEARASIR